MGEGQCSTERDEIRLTLPALEPCIAMTGTSPLQAVVSEQTTLNLAVEGMTCASCVGRVEKVLATVPGVSAAAVNLATETATVRDVEGATTPAELARAATALGYPARVKAGEDTAKATRKADRKPNRKAAEITRLGWLTLIAAALALPVFAIEVGSHLIPGIHMWIERTIGLQTSRLIQVALTTAVLSGPGLRFYTKGVALLFKGAPDMNSLVALGTSAAYGFSLVSTFAPGLLPESTANVYLEAAAVIVVLILLGHWLEARAKGRTGEAIRKLVGLQAKTARVERGGAVVEVPIEEIAVGDVIQVHPGEKTAVDGTVLTGRSYIDESMIIGTPVPVEKTQGAEVVGATVNGSGALTYRATKVGADTMLAQIISMVEQDRVPSCRSRGC